jgi:hypothetical protein
MARKSEVYTWRVSPSTKASLEEEARSSNRSVARLLDEIVLITSVRRATEPRRTSNTSGGFTPGLRALRGVSPAPDDGASECVSSSGRD